MCPPCQTRNRIGPDQLKNTFPDMGAYVCVWGRGDCGVRVYLCVWMGGGGGDAVRECICVCEGGGGIAVHECICVGEGGGGDCGA